MDEDVVSALVRWTDSGALWRVISRDATSVTVSMCSCDGLDEMQQIHTEDPAAIEWIGERDSSEDL